MHEALEKARETEAQKKSRILEELTKGAVEYVTYPPERDLPVPETLHPDAQACIEAIDYYLNLPTVVDKKDAFENHQERRRWRHTLTEEQRDMYEHNALRGNHINAVMPRIELFLSQTNVLDEKERGDLIKQHRDIMKDIALKWGGADEHSSGSGSPGDKIDFLNQRLYPYLVAVREILVR